MPTISGRHQSILTRKTPTDPTSSQPSPVSDATCYTDSLKIVRILKFLLTTHLSTQARYRDLIVDIAFHETSTYITTIEVNNELNSDHIPVINIYMKGLQHSGNIQTVMYADDTTLISKHQDKHLINENL
ncbi:hypothetical protein CEXT_19351 [Caerostris extrusa]|uniref:Reverse transcriptase domain-containing protein n=1 Tax=Caerostris extrusa TaxID=172846 RepID=A0AAV4Y1N9_CAEEX|nr:hypothetical protein CEXT_19351 [Caerostris extrusa]